MRRLAAAAVLAAAAAGCQTGIAGPEEQARSTVEAFLLACAREDPNAAVDLLSPPAQAELVAAEGPLEGCRRLLGLAPLEALPDERLRDAFRAARVVQVREEGGFGEASVEAPGGARSVLSLEDTGDRWLIERP